MVWRPLHREFLSLRKRHLFNLYLLVGGVSIVVATTIFTLRISKSVENQSYQTTRLFSNLASRLLDPENLEDVRPVIDIINEIEVPFVITTKAGRPVLWNEPVIGIPMPSSNKQLISDDPNKPRNPLVREILSLAAQYDQDQEPFAIITPEGERLGTLHYGQSDLSQRVRWMPYIELAIMALFFLVILWALQNQKEAQQKALFAGMAKETAHQLGTPLTSIMGWVALLEDRLGKTDDVLTELNRDVNRLGMVSARFSQIGSMPKLEDTDINTVVDDAVDYFQRRLPHFGGRVELRREGHSLTPLRFNEDLFGWVLENLIKNGIDALKDGKGTISIKLDDLPGGGVWVQVNDTGIGIPSRVGNRIFEPGFTTKKRGWGMGLALVKRIITQYHGGRIRIESTGPHGTTIGLYLPPADKAMAGQPTSKEL